jgi:hypothetical protein
MVLNTREFSLVIISNSPLFYGHPEPYATTSLYGQCVEFSLASDTLPPIRLEFPEVGDPTDRQYYSSVPVTAAGPDDARD